MNKYFKTIRYLTISFGFLLTLFLFLPLYEVNGHNELAFLVIFGLRNSSFDPFTFITFLLPSVASLFLLLRKKNMELVSFLFFLLTSFAFFFLKDFTHFINKDISIELIKTTQTILIILSLLSVLLTFTLALEKEAFQTSEIVEMAMFVSLAVILDLPGFKIRLGAAGGSISLTMLPLLIFSLRHGVLKGFIASGVIYGFLTSVLDGWGFVYYPFDYLLGYGAMSLVGFFKPFILNHKISRLNLKGVLFLILGIVISIVGRLFASTLSGMIYYEYTFFASLIYNVSYLLPSALIVIASFILLYGVLIRLDNMFPIRK